MLEGGRRGRARRFFFSTACNTKEKYRLGRISLIRFDSEDFGKGVRAVGLRLQPVGFSNYNMSCHDSCLAFYLQ